MKIHLKAVHVSGDTIELSYEIGRPRPIPTRTKFRRRRFLRVVRTAAFKAAHGNIGVPLSPEAHSSVAGQVIQVCRDTAKRYAHLRT